MSLRTVLVVFFTALLIWSFATWLDVVAIQLTHPEWLTLPFTHISIFPLNMRTDTFGIAAFIIWLFSMIALGLVVFLMKKDRGGQTYRR